MRDAFIKTLVELAEAEERIILLSGDLGFMALENFSERFKDRFFNVGVAEQNMVGMATGLAESGFIPFIYSIATFAVLRPFEFIRNGPILHQFPVRIVGVGGGFEYGQNGITHYGLEDVGIMRTQPGITVVAPADYQQARNALLATWNLPGPVYYRLSKDDKSLVKGLNGRFELGRAQFIGEGRDALIITMGNIALEAALAVDQLSSRGIPCTMMVISSIAPAPLEDLVSNLSRFRLAITVEAHYLEGGIGSMVSEVIAGEGLGCRLIRCAVKGRYDGISGSKNFLYHKHGLSPEALVDTVLNASKDKAIIKQRGKI